MESCQRLAEQTHSRIPVLFPFSLMPCDLLSREPGLIKAGFHRMGARDAGSWRDEVLIGSLGL